MEMDRDVPDADRLERLWAGDFGNEYLERNIAAGVGRDTFWRELLQRHPVSRVLEIGCSSGANLQWIAPLLPPGGTFGVDVNVTALAQLRKRLPAVNAVAATARDLPFRDAWFDLTFTTGVLIHQPEATVDDVMGEVVRVSRRYVLCGEYHAEETTEVSYRGIEGALFKRDYRRRYLTRFPELRLLDEGRLGRSEGWDDVTWCLFAKS